jgi:hypothetical protein
LSIDLSFLYPLYSLDPLAVWKGQLALLISLAVAAAVSLIPLNPESRALRWLKICGVAGIMFLGALQFALLIRYLFYPSYLNHGGPPMPPSCGWAGRATRSTRDSIQAMFMASSTDRPFTR